MTASLTLLEGVAVLLVRAQQTGRLDVASASLSRLGIRAWGRDEEQIAVVAQLVKQVLDIAMSSEKENALFPKDAGDKIYRSMYNDTMSNALSGNLGISEILFDYLKEGR